MNKASSKNNGTVVAIGEARKDLQDTPQPFPKEEKS
jgi:hypothetical protein